MENYILPDVLEMNLYVVICGTAPGFKSALNKAYYANPQNRFWKTLYQIGLTPYQVESKDYKDLINFGIGLTDLAKKTFGNDSDLSKKDFSTNELKSKILHYKPKILCFNSKRSAIEFLGHKVSYGFQNEIIGTTKIFVAPSTSPAAIAFWNLNIWQSLANEITKLRNNL